MPTTSLGVEHDGEGDIGRSCSIKDGYIMAPVISQVDGQTLINAHTFSKCSELYMKRHLDFMNGFVYSSHIIINCALVLNIIT